MPTLLNQSKNFGRQFTDLIDNILGFEKQADPIRLQQRIGEAHPELTAETPVLGGPSDADVFDFMAGVGRGLVGDTAQGLAQIAGNVVQAQVPFVDLKEAGEKHFGGADSDSVIGQFLARLNPKPTLDEGLSGVTRGFDILSLGGTTEEYAKRLRERKEPAELAPLYTAVEVVGLTPILEGLFGQEAVTGRQLDTFEQGRRIGGGVLPLEVVGGAAVGAVRAVSGKKPKFSRVAAEEPRLVTRADIQGQAEKARASKGDAVSKLTPEEAASALANDPEMQLTQPDVDAAVDALVQSNPEFNQILTPESLRESIFGSHEDILAALRELPDDKKTLQISDQIADVLRSQPGLPEARIVQISEQYGVPRQQVIDRVMVAQSVIADNIVSGKQPAGGFLHELSDISKTVEALQATSPNVVDRMAAINNRLARKRGWWDIIGDTFIRPALASAVSGFGNAMRDMISQMGVKWTRALEHSIEGMGLMTARNIEDFNRRRKGLADSQRLPDSHDWADALNEMVVFTQHGRNMADRFRKQMSDEGMAWSRDAIIAEHKGTSPPPLPKSLENEFNFLWGRVIDSVPGGQLHMISNTLADINSAGIKAEHVRLLKEKIDKAGLPGDRARNLVDAARISGDIWANAVTLPRRAIDLEQRRMFFAMEATPHALRNGVDVTTPQGLRELDRLMNMTVDEGRPAWVDTMYRDAMDGSLKTTFSADPEISVFKKYVDMHQKAPWLNLLGLKFPRFVTNKLAFIMERQPLQVFGMFKPEFIKSLGGNINEAAFLDDLVQATPEAKAKWQKSLRTTDVEQRRVLQDEARQIAQGREDLSVMRDRAVQRVQQKTMKEFSKGLTGMTMLYTAMQLRNGGYAGPRYNLVDMGPVDARLPEGERRLLDTRNWGYWGDYMAAATVINALLEGRNPFDDIGADDIAESITGIRRINEDTVLALGDIIRSMSQGQANGEMAEEFASTWAASNFGMATAFFRNLRDVESIAELDDSPILQDTRSTNPWLGQAIANLPNKPAAGLLENLSQAPLVGSTIGQGIEDLAGLMPIYQGKARELVSAGQEQGPLPNAINPFNGKPLYQSSAGLKIVSGFNLRTMSGIERLLNITGMSRRVLIGRHGNDDIDELMAQHLGAFLGQPVDEEGRTIGDYYVQMALEVADARAAEGFNYRESLKEQMRRNFEVVRKIVKPQALADYALFDQEAFVELMATKGLAKSDRMMMEAIIKQLQAQEAGAQ